MGLTLAEILAAPRTSNPIPVNVPEWGDKPVYVISPSAFAMDQFNAQQAQRRENAPGSQYEDLTARIVCMVLCDESGTLLATPAHFREFSKMPSTVLDRIWQVVKPWFGVSQDDVERAAKNSQTTTVEGSVSG
jgi:hypothetical protein